MALSKITNGGIGTVDDITVSSGLYIGGTGAANLLDDYEEGTWTPTAVTNISSLSVTGAKYTKIGNLVFATCRVGVQASATNPITFGGLPFTATALGSGMIGQGNTNFDFEGGTVDINTTEFRLNHNLGTSGARTCNISVLYQTA
jgi:hypothetical protein